MPPRSAPAQAPSRLDAKVLVIGSGPGGAMTACTLAEAGHEVLLVEEGDHVPVGATEPYSLDDMERKWRNGGLTPSFGPVKVTYVEGKCVGGASEINAALYHPPVPSVLDQWARDYGIADFGGDVLARHIEAIEREASVSPFPGSPGIASERLAAGAASLGWKSVAVKRFWKYDGTEVLGRRQSMTETYIPRARAAGARLQDGLKVKRLLLEGRRAVGAIATDRDGRRVEIRADRVIVCGGAVQTALILRRSGITRGVGNTLSMNPMIRVAAEFDDCINEPAIGVPVLQIEAFKPEMTLGCSNGTLAHLALWLVGAPENREQLLAEWWRLGVFYAKVMAKARGFVRNVPLVDEAFVSFRLGKSDLALLGLAAERLATLLLASGARAIISPVPGMPAVRSLNDIPALRAGVEAGKAQVTAIHLHSTVPMGSEQKGCPADAFGKLRGLENVWVNDASLLPDTPGINPQGTILAIARRNAERMLG
ncbi:MAG: GMC family oxidoreductase [Pseudomonadota bacterium]|nr:GMC family oxidoreductase [Pseudomonadota bacterium]